MLALQSRQLSATQDLMASAARAEGAEAMRHAEVENASQAEWQSFYGSGVGYSATQVQVFSGASP
jgi:type IV secretion system protein TrbJ